jgi:hypothetical protein
MMVEWGWEAAGRRSRYRNYAKSRCYCKNNGPEESRASHRHQSREAASMPRSSHTLGELTRAAGGHTTARGRESRSAMPSGGSVGLGSGRGITISWHDMGVEVRASVWTAAMPTFMSSIHATPISPASRERHGNPSTAFQTEGSALQWQTQRTHTPLLQAADRAPAGRRGWCECDR